MMHTLERFISPGDDTPLTDNIAIGLLKAVIDAGRIVMKNPQDYDARATLMWANSLSHNGLTSCGREFVMSVHQLEHELSGKFDNIAHGAGLAVLWPAWALKAYKYALNRFLKLSYEVMNVTPTQNKEADAIKGINLIKEFFKEIKMPTTLKELNVDEKDFEELAYNAMFKGKRTLKDVIEVDYKMALEILKSAK